jgi:signal transduction histidine kinase
VLPHLRLPEDLASRSALSPGLRRIVAFLLILAIGFLDYIAPTNLATDPFYIPILVILALYESWAICLGFSLLAALIHLGVTLSSAPDTVRLIYPYWQATARLIGFSLISVTVSLLVAERRRLRLLEESLREKSQELEEKNRTLEKILQELKKLQDDVVTKERRAAIAQTIHAATHEMERPLASLSVYVDELLRFVRRDHKGTAAQLLLEEIQPMVEKIHERTQNMETILEQIRDFRKREGGA